MSNKRSKEKHRRHGESSVVDTASPLFDRFNEMRTCKFKNAYDTEWQAKFVIDKQSANLANHYIPNSVHIAIVGI